MNCFIPIRASPHLWCSFVAGCYSYSIPPNTHPATRAVSNNEQLAMSN